MKNTCSCRVGGLWLNNCAFYAQLYFKMEKGVAGAIFKQHHPNFQKLHIFWRLINDIIMSFWKNCYCQIYRKCHSVSNPVFLVILGLSHSYCIRMLHNESTLNTANLFNAVFILLLHFHSIFKSVKTL